jgi:hypothetical protein
MAWSERKVRQLFADDPIRLQQALGKKDYEAEARQLLAQALAEMEGPVDEIGTWIRAAKRLGVKNVHKLARGEGPGYYVWQDRTIYYNPHTDAITAIVEFAHEWGHDLLAYRRTGSMRHGIQRFDGYRYAAQQQICVYFQEMARTIVLAEVARKALSSQKDISGSAP